MIDGLKISKKVAEDNSLDIKLVTLINRVQWEYLYNSIKFNPYDEVKITYLGKFLRNKLVEKVRNSAKFRRQKLNESSTGDISGI
jgi:hypothetical protein